MAQGPSDTILVAIRITPQIRESKVRNPDPPDRRRFVLSECISCLFSGSHTYSVSESLLFRSPRLSSVCLSVCPVPDLEN